MNTSKIENIWETLEFEGANHSGLLYKRYSAEVIPDIFLAMKTPEKLKGLAIRIGYSYQLNEQQWKLFKDIKIESIDDEKDKTKRFLLILLLNKRHQDIFAVLCEDLILGVSHISQENRLIESLLERLAKWQSMFERLGKQGLSEEAQRGLFGEVFFLKLFLDNSHDKNYPIKSWIGPEKAIQDFQHANWAVEVKTTHGNNHQKIHISSERQLDDSIITNIYLYHLSLDIRVGYGETLNALIESTLKMLDGNTIAANLFQIKLLEYGYFENHRPLYEEKGYVIRQENIYRVTGNFPRIIESQIPNGVGDVKYSIVISESEDWRISLETMFEAINNN